MSFCVELADETNGGAFIIYQSGKSRYKHEKAFHILTASPAISRLKLGFMELWECLNL